MTEQEVRNIIREELAGLLMTDRYTFQKPLQIFDGKHVQLGKTNGTKFGTEATQKIGFLGKTPVVRQAAISDPSGGLTIDANARTAINSIIDVLQAFGFIA